MNAISSRIKEYAYDIGFSLAGIAPADDFTEFIEHIKERDEDYAWWVSSPREPMLWAQPKAASPGAKSLVVLVYDYAQRRFPQRLCALLGRIYQSRSYLAPKENINGMRVELMKQFLVKEGMSVTDAVWLPQRWAGLRAGVTSFGKNTFAYAPRLGSFIVLNTLVVDQELEYEKPAEKACPCPQDCRRCIDACPTGALYEPFKLNPRRCIAFNNWMPGVTYLPRDIRPLMQQRVHGCDFCQEACPRNKAVLDANGHRPQDPLLEMLADELRLEDMLHMPEGYYESRIRPVMYNYISDRRLFRRNAAVAIGNTRDARHLPALEAELNDPDPLIRAHVAWAIKEIGGADAQAMLSARRKVETDEKVLEEL
jgi:epoxyqueuosine reductase